MSTASNTPPEGYFNDLSRPTGNGGQDRRNHSPTWDGNGAQDGTNMGDAAVPKPKRIACVICRKRKLKCDGSKPSCSTCTRLGHNCAYDEVRRKSGPKRGYVKALEERLKQVETLLKTQDPPGATSENVSASFTGAQSNVSSAGLQAIANPDFQSQSQGVLNGLTPEGWRYNKESPQQPMDDLTFTSDMTIGMGLDDSTITWEMIGLGLEEPLPPQDTIDDLHQIFFDKIHHNVPMIHKFRYLAAMNLAPNQRPPVALRYAIWTLAASAVDKYADLTDHFYRRSRKYMEIDYMKGHGEHLISIAHAQTHVLLASFEFKMMYFPRAWQSTGSAIRLCQMMSLHRLDGNGLDVKQCFPPPRDWTEGEERRRTFWMAFCEDRYSSIGTGWPMTIDEKDILTDLPASDEAFEMGRPEKTPSLAESMTPAGASKLSAFGGIVLMACLFGRNLIHLHRPDADGCDDDLNGDFWKRHRNMDNILLNTSLSMPPHLRLPNGLSNPNIIFTNMNIHTSTICLHQAAIYKAEKNRLPASISAESKVRCITAANEIAGIMRIISHVDLSSMNPFISFCLYVAARVFVQYLKSRPDDDQAGDSLRFLLSAMNVLKRKNPLTESFLIQLDVDLEGLGLRKLSYKAVFAYDKVDAGRDKLSQFGKSFPKESFPTECAFFRSVDSQDDSPIAPPETSTSSHQESNPVRGAVIDDAFKVFNPEQLDWLPLRDLQTATNELSARPLNSTTYGGPGDSSSSAYINSGSSNGADTGLSPDTGQSGSNRPTPNSASPSETRSNLQSGQKNSAGTSYHTSPEVSHESQLPNTDARPTGSPFASQLDHRRVTTTGLTPDNTFSMPATPGRDFPAPGWEMNGQSTGLTPIGEGVFRQLYGLGPMDAMPMDLGWEGNPET